MTQLYGSFCAHVTLRGSSQRCGVTPGGDLQTARGRVSEMPAAPPPAQLVTLHVALGPYDPPATLRFHTTTDRPEIKAPRDCSRRALGLRSSRAPRPTHQSRDRPPGADGAHADAGQGPPTLSGTSATITSLSRLSGPDTGAQEAAPGALSRTPRAHASPKRGKQETQATPHTGSRWQLRDRQATSPSTCRTT